MGEGEAAESLKKHKVMRLVSNRLFIGIAAFLLVLGLLFVSGLLYAGVKKPHERVVLQTSVCGQQAVLDKLAAYINPQESEEGVNYTQAVAEVRSHSHYDSDPTCVVALAYFYFQMNDAKNMKIQVDALKGFSSAGSFPSNKLQLAWNLAEAEENLRIIER